MPELTHMTTEHGKMLLIQARQSIVNQFGKTDPVEVNAPWLKELGATFVTLTQQGRLRGCIGSLQAHRALLEDVRQNAVAAAFRDPRFEPLIAEELAVTQVEVSLLSPHEPMIFSSEEEVLKQLRPGIDGVVFQCGHYCSTFLPQVWEQLPEPQQFMAHLKRKAGLSERFWADEVKLARYTVRKWKEQGSHVQD